MAKDLKILSINFPFKAPWVVQAETLATPLAFFDYDVVVIRPYLLPGSRAGGPWSIDGRPYHRAKREMRGKIEDTVRLLNKGGLLVVPLDSVQEFKYDTGANSYMPGTLYTLTNYDFLDGQFFRGVRNGTGTNVEILHASEPFAPVIRNSRIEWTSFLVAKPPPFEKMVFFARNGPGSFVGGYAPAGIGNVVFLPNFKTLDEDRFFEACREYRYHRDGMPPPEWCKKVFLPGSLQVSEKLAEIEGQLSNLEDLRKEATRERDELLAYKKLLYEKGRTQLEPIVRKAFDKLGFGTTPGETISGTGFEIDGRSTVGSMPGILEIKGSKKQIVLDEFSPFIPKILADLNASGRRSKGVLVGNGLCEMKPKDRVGQKVFSSHVLDAATAHSIALVNSVDLYCIVCGVLSGDIKDLAPIREKILTTNGFVELLDYRGDLPFSDS